MGNGIAHVFAQHGFPVQLIDLQAIQLEKAMATILKNLKRQVQKGTITADEKIKTIERIHPAEQIAAGIRDADIIIEAATENEALKLKIFRELDENSLPSAILATNT